MNVVARPAASTSVRAGLAPQLSLLALETAVPPNPAPQAAIRDHVRQYLNTRSGIFETLADVYTNAAIENRYLAEPVGWYLNSRTFGEKCQSYAERSVALARELAERCLAAAGLTPEAIDAIVCVSSTGILTPSLDARLMNLMPFRRDTVRLPVFGYGCAGGVLGLARAGEMAAARPGSKVLLLVVELCSLAIRHDRFAPSNVVAMALFGDGAAGAIISSDPADAGAALGTLGPSGEHCWQDTLDIMGWSIDGNGLDVIFHRSIPTVVQNDYAGALVDFLRREDLRLSDFRRVCCHPGGVKVLDALEDVLGLERDALDAEREVLRRFGNMSAPTVLFVLSELIRRGLSGPVLLSSLGPGFCAAFHTVNLATRG